MSAAPRGEAGLVAERLACFTPGPAEREANRDALTFRIGDRAGQQATGQLVVTLGQADGELGLRPSVQLGGPTGAGAAAPGRPGVLDRQQPFLGEPVEVELDHMTGDAGALGDLVPVHRPWP